MERGGGLGGWGAGERATEDAKRTTHTSQIKVIGGSCSLTPISRQTSVHCPASESPDSKEVKIGSFCRRERKITSKKEKVGGVGRVAG